MIQKNDLDHVFGHTKELWEAARSKRIFITGGTGFFGCWLLSTFLDANERLELNAEIVVLTRDSAAFHRKIPELAGHPCIKFVEGDVRNFLFPEGDFEFVIHAATEVSAQSNVTKPVQMLDVVSEGTRRTLELARLKGASRFLLTSSGAVYGQLAPDMVKVSEDYIGSPDSMDPNAAYGQGKRFAESLCVAYSKAYGFDAVIARSFAVVGPFLPLDLQFAVGNFIRDGLNNRPIAIAGDGTPCRSYLYGADLAIWLWTLLFRGKSCYPYNVGSDEEVSILELAQIVAEAFAPQIIPVSLQKVNSVNQGLSANRYIPSIERAKQDLGLAAHTGLAEGVRRSIDWYRQTQARFTA